MCGINIYNKPNLNIDIINNLCKKRGPDNTNILIKNNITFIHNLLHITGEKIIQPFIDDNIVCLFNGEIYNYLEFDNTYKSDGLCLIPLYKKHGINFTQYLDGEFAICLIDFDKDYLLISTDIFSTKPLFYSFENEYFMISSLNDSLQKATFSNIKKLEANTSIIFNLKDFNIINKISIYNFDLNQHKNNFDDWNKAFENAIIKRTKNNKFYLGLSSGYDSGAICFVLNKYHIKYHTYTIIGSENKNIIEKRLNINNSTNNIYNLGNHDKMNHLNYISNNCDEFTKKIKIFNKKKKRYSVKKDKGSVGCSYISDIANKNNYKINISGQGADEILSDYGFNGKKIKSHSCFGGKFPEDLNKIFPWSSVFGGIGECLLMKEELIAGSYGIENRYPFLDKNVVQEFLWLSHELKNKNYKAPLHNYLTINNYPFQKNKKIGFDP